MLPRITSESIEEILLHIMFVESLKIANFDGA
jgi:hypothetical protein